jgi:hypothetical protein
MREGTEGKIRKGKIRVSEVSDSFSSSLIIVL